MKPDELIREARILRERLWSEATRKEREVLTQLADALEAALAQRQQDDEWRNGPAEAELALLRRQLAASRDSYNRAREGGNKLHAQLAESQARVAILEQWMTGAVSESKFADDDPAALSDFTTESLALWMERCGNMSPSGDRLRTWHYAVAQRLRELEAQRDQR